jgi:hypothetical protein
MSAHAVVENAQNEEYEYDIPIGRLHLLLILKTNATAIVMRPSLQISLSHRILQRARSQE